MRWVCAYLQRLVGDGMDEDGGGDPLLIPDVEIKDEQHAEGKTKCAGLHVHVAAESLLWCTEPQLHMHVASDTSVTHQHAAQDSSHS